MRERLLRHDGGTAFLYHQCLGLLHFNAHRPQGHALAGQNGALCQFFFGEQIARLRELAHLPLDKAALAGGTAAYAAAVWKVDAFAQSRSQNRFA